MCVVLLSRDPPHRSHLVASSCGLEQSRHLEHDFSDPTCAWGSNLAKSTRAAGDQWTRSIVSPTVHGSSRSGATRISLAHRGVSEPRVLRFWAFPRWTPWYLTENLEAELGRSAAITPSSWILGHGQPKVSDSRPYTRASSLPWAPSSCLLQHESAPRPPPAPFPRYSTFLDGHNHFTWQIGG